MSAQNESPILLPGDDRDGQSLHGLTPPKESEITSGGVAIPRSRRSRTTHRGVAVPNLPDEAERTAKGILKPQSASAPEIAVADQPLPSQSEKQTPGIEQEKLYFMARPLEYFASRLEKHQLPSPMKEIAKKVKKFGKKLPKLSPEEVMLINSPLSYVREKALEELEGVDAGTIQDLRRKDFAPSIVDTSTLKFAWPEEATELPTQFYDFLRKVIEEQFPKETNFSTETIQHIGQVTSYLEMITEAFQYRHQTYKLVDNQLMDLIAQRLEPLLQKLGRGKKHSPAMDTLFDFLSHFEIGSTAALKIFRKILNTYGENHPLRHAIGFQLEGKRATPKPKGGFERIGLEMEFVPMIFLNEVPEGFTIGIDIEGGSGTSLPELRRNKDRLFFNAEYKKDLFELWYWAKMAKVQGVSIHLHLDHPPNVGIVFEHFRRIFGDNNDSVRLNSLYEDDKSTIEIRLNMDSYIKKKRVNSRPSINRPFFAKQFNLNLLIEELIKIKNETVQFADNKVLIGKRKASINPYLDSFWRARFQDKSGPEEQNRSQYFLEQLMNDDLSSNEIEGLIRKLPSPQTMDLKLLMAIGEKMKWNPTYITPIFSRLPEQSIPPSFLIKLKKEIPTHQQQIMIINTVIEKLFHDSMTLKLLRELGDVISLSGLFSATEKFPDNSINLKLLEEIGEKTDWDSGLVPRIIKKIPKKLIDLELIKYLSEKIGWNTRVTQILLTELPKQQMTWDFIEEIGENTYWGKHVIPAAIEKLPDESLDLDFLIELGEKLAEMETLDHDRRLQTIIPTAFCKLKNELATIETIKMLVEKFSVSKSRMVKHAFEILPNQNINIVNLKNLIEESSWSWQATRALFQKFSSQSISKTEQAEAIQVIKKELNTFKSERVSIIVTSLKFLKSWLPIDSLLFKDEKKGLSS